MHDIERTSTRPIAAGSTTGRSESRPLRQLVCGVLFLVLGVSPIASHAEDWLELAERFASVSSGEQCSIAEHPGRAADLDEGLVAAHARIRAACWMRERRFHEAVRILAEQRAQSTAPDAELDVLLAIGLYHVGDYDAAQAHFDAAGDEASRSGLAQFYRGMLLLQDDQPQAATAAMRGAVALDPDLLRDGAVYYYSVLSEIRAGDDEAAQRVSRVFSAFVDPESVWGREVERLMRSGG